MNSHQTVTSDWGYLHSFVSKITVFVHVSQPLFLQTRWPCWQGHYSWDQQCVITLLISYLAKATDERQIYFEIASFLEDQG